MWVNRYSHETTKCRNNHWEIVSSITLPWTDLDKVETNKSKHHKSTHECVRVCMGALQVPETCIKWNGIHKLVARYVIDLLLQVWRDISIWHCEHCSPLLIHSQQCWQIENSNEPFAFLNCDDLRTAGLTLVQPPSGAFLRDSQHSLHVSSINHLLREKVFNRAINTTQSGNELHL